MVATLVEARRGEWVYDHDQFNELQLFFYSLDNKFAVSEQWHNFFVFCFVFFKNTLVNSLWTGRFFAFWDWMIAWIGLCLVRLKSSICCMLSYKLQNTYWLQQNQINWYIWKILFLLENLEITETIILNIFSIVWLDFWKYKVVK